MKQPHKHAEFIKAWADGAEIEYNFDGTWEPLEPKNWEGKGKFRIVPERIYPTTSLNIIELVEHYSGKTQSEKWDGVTGDLFAVANAAIKQHIIDSESKK